MQDEDPFPPFDERSEGNAEVQREASELNMELEQQQQEQSGEQQGEPGASQPGATEPREGAEGELVNRDVTHSESGEGTCVELVLLRTDISACSSKLTIQANARHSAPSMLFSCFASGR